MDLTSVPRENLIRGLALAGGAPALTLARAPPADGPDGPAAAAQGPPTGHFPAWDTWTEISSWYEGEFLERIAKGAAKKTIAENLGAVKVQFDHGYDDYVGGAPLGPIDLVEEDDIGCRYDVPLLDTDYNRDRVLPLLQGRLMNGETRGSLLGASFRFRVMQDSWVEEPGVSAWNPKGLPERTITEFKLFEFGPVVFPAYGEASAEAGMRSLTDHYLEMAREKRSATRSAQPPAGSTTGGSEPDEPAPGHSASPDEGRSLAVALTDIERLRRAS